MPFRPTFDCLWCGRAWRASDEADLTGWAALCPECLDRAQDNGFLRYRVRTALRERSGSTSIGQATPTGAAALATRPATAAVRPAEQDDWYLRRGRFSRGPARDLAWQVELDTATSWLDGQPLAGEIVELAAGTGWWSPLLAGKGVLSLYDADPQLLERARERLVAHRLQAHLHVRDAWAEPDRPVDGVFTARWLGGLEGQRLTHGLALIRRWLRPGGRFVFLDALPDPESGPVDGPALVMATRAPTDLADALRLAGFGDAQVTTTPRFFVMGSAVRGD
jgi:hypothetical protein